MYGERAYKWTELRIELLEIKGVLEQAADHIPSLYFLGSIFLIYKLMGISENVSYR